MLPAPWGIRPESSPSGQAVRPRPGSAPYPHSKRDVSRRAENRPSNTRALISALIDEDLKLAVGDFVLVDPIILEGQLRHSFIAGKKQSPEIFLRRDTHHARWSFRHLVESDLRLDRISGWHRIPRD